MFQELFNSLSVLFSFSKSLNTVSNNVANMNTPGFRGSDTFLENINGGLGSRVAGEGLRTQAGDLRQTGTPTDLAINGNGYFILRDTNGNLYYTRAGQFRFNDDGLLSDSVTGYNVMAIDQAGNLTTIDLDNYRTLDPKPTTSVDVVGNVNITAVVAPATPNSYTMPDMQVYDATGTVHTLSLKITDNRAVTPGSYLVTVTENGVAVATTPTSGEIRFDTTGSLQVGFNTLALGLTTGATTQSITLNFGTPGAITGGTSNRTGIPSSLAGHVVDGRPTLGVTGLSFDTQGILQLVYSSNETQQGPQIALASFANESSLELVGGRLISGGNIAQRTIGRPGEGVFGHIAGGSLELANVDLTQEFADMIIIQRGYQASSRVMTVSNEMIEQLYNSTRGG